MTTHWGNEGIAKFAANSIAEVDSFDVDQTVAPVGDTAMGDAWMTHIPGSGHKSWKGSLKCHWDETDTNGQEAAVVGASVTLNLYPEGDASTDIELSGTATVTSVKIEVSKDNIVARTIEFEGNGALVQGAVV
jgi:hypothetical protein